MNARLLVVDDDPAMCTMLSKHLGRHGFEVTTSVSAEAAFAALRAQEFDVVVTDLNMRGMNGLELCERIAGDRPDVSVVVITAFGSLESAIAAIRAGAYDFIPKPFEIDALVLALERAVQHRALREEVKRLRLAAQGSRLADGVRGESSAMHRVFDLLERVRDTDSSVLITGESGTGKELVARQLHERSHRRRGPFVAVNCAALPEPLLESELFGHARGAFTDARSARTGLFSQADGGTLFLDEIGEMPLGLQPKILRALQEKTIRPIGSNTEVRFDARIIAATNRDLETAIDERDFREDLYYRINVIHVDLPPLRLRGNDVLMLAQQFVQRFAAAAGRAIVGISPAAAQKLLGYTWPGNVRELQNCIERAVAVAQYTEVAVEDLPEKIRNYSRAHVVVAADEPGELLTMEEVERRYVLHVLEVTGGNKTLAAQLLGFDRTTLYRKLERFGVQK